MRLSKIPVALVIAAMVSVTAVTIYLYLSLVPVPVVADPNFTGTLVAGSPYLWRGAASTIEISSNATIGVTYMPVGYVVAVNGPLTNATLGRGVWLVYLSGGRPLLVIMTNYTLYAFRLVDAFNVNGITVLVPQTFSATDYLTYQESEAIAAFTNILGAYRVTDVETNGTHIILQLSDSSDNSVWGYLYFRLPTPALVTTANYNFAGYGISHVVNGTTVSMYVEPYEYFVITPQYNAQVTIVAK